MKDYVAVVAVLGFTLSAGSAWAACSDPGVPCDIDAPGDYDGDGDIDNADYNFFKNCATRATVPAPSANCDGTDFDGDGDADPSDFGTWQLLYTGACDCGPNLKEPPVAPPALPGAPDDLACWRPTQEPRSVSGVYAFSGEFHMEAEDLRIPGRGLDVVCARKYRSRLVITPGPNAAMGVMGKQWDFSYNVRIEEAGPHLRLYDGNGRSDVFYLQPDGTWQRHKFFAIIDRSRASYKATFADTSLWNFRDLDGSPAAGKIASSVDRNGNTLTFDYDALGRLVTIHDTLDTAAHDRDFTIAYNADGYIASVTDFAGRTVTYAYYQNTDAGGSAGDLKSMTTPPVTGTPNGNDFPTGKTTIYTYSKGFADEALNHNLLTITDPKGQTYLTNVYSSSPDAPPNLLFDRVTRQVLGSPGDNIDLVYKTQAPSAGNNFATVKATVNDRVGNVSEYMYDNFNRLVSYREYTGRANPDQPTDLDTSTNPPTSPLRPTDPAFFETRYEYNIDSLLTRVVYPNGNDEQFTYDSANPSRRSRGNLLQHLMLPGTLGGDQSQIAETFEYNPAINFDTNFVTRHVDGRGNQTLYTYDARGNRLHTQHRIPTIVEDFEYNTFGQMTARIWPDNGSGHRRRDEFSYYDPGLGCMGGYLKERIIDVPGFELTTTYEYDCLGRLTRSIDPRGNDSLYTWNPLDQVVRTASAETPGPAGPVRYHVDYHYDANDNLVRVDVENIDDQGVLQPNTHFTTTYEYDILNYLTRITREVDPADEAVTEYAYDANRNSTLVRFGEAVNGNQAANKVQILYDERDLVFVVTRAPGNAGQSSNQYDYDANGNLKRTAQGLEGTNRIFAYTYDGYDRLLQTTDPMGNQTFWHYDANGNGLSQRTEGQMVDIPGSSGNVRLAEASHTYDAMDRLTRQDLAFFNPQTQAPIGDGISRTDYFYNDNSQVVRMVDDNNTDYAFLYDTANRIGYEVDVKDNRKTYTYDANSNVIQVAELDKSDLGNPDQAIITGRVYNALDQQTKLISNLLKTTQYSCDSRGNLVLLTDARGNQTRYAYDGLNRLTETDAALSDTGDGSGTVIGTITTQQTWDDSSRLTAQIDGNGHSTVYEYDALDRRSRRTHADTTLHQFTYDVHDNLTQMTDSNGTVIMASYDLRNRLTARSVLPGAGVVGTTNETYVYDGLSRRVSAQDNDTAVTFAYDSLSNATRETQQLLGSPPAPAQIITRSYDGLGNLLSCTYPGGRVITRTYDALHRLAGVTEPGAPMPLATLKYIGPYRLERMDYGNNTRLDVTYDGDRSELQRFHARLSPTPQTIDVRVNGWDPSYNKTQVQQPQASPPRTTQYAYDSVNRLGRSQIGSATPVVYTFDNAGNRTSVSGPVDPGTYVMNPTLPEPADAQVNQYTSTPFDSRTYDKKGNLVGTFSSPRQFSYDYRNQLVQFTDAAAGANATYQYDPFGRRIARTVNGAQTRFYYDATAEIEEQDASNATQATFVARNDGYIQMVQLAQESFFHTDDLGSTAAITDAAGNVVERYEYQDYGRPAVSVYAQSPDANVAYLSDADPHMGIAQIVADDFTFSRPVRITGLRWWGSYGFGATPASDDFTIRIHADGTAGPGPGAVLHTEHPGGDVSRTATGRTIAVGNTPEYQYQAELATPYQAAPGQIFWLELTNNTAGSPATWGWVSSVAGNTQLYYNENGGPWQPEPADTAFELFTDESSIGNPYLFTGRRYDPETGFYHYRSRYLDPYAYGDTGNHEMGHGLGMASSSYLDPRAGRSASKGINSPNLLISWAGNNPTSGTRMKGDFSRGHQPDHKRGSAGGFSLRDYTVQYRESDFNFASRLMEEEGVYYFFQHTDVILYDDRRRRYYPYVSGWPVPMGPPPLSSNPNPGILSEPMLLRVRGGVIPASAAAGPYIKMGDIKGESEGAAGTQDAMKRVLFGAAGFFHDGGAGGGGGGGGGRVRVNMNDFSIPIVMDKSSVRFFKNPSTTRGGNIGKIDLSESGRATPFGGGSAGGDAIPIEEISFNYAKIEYSYKPQKADGSLSGNKPLRWYDPKQK